MKLEKANHFLVTFLCRAYKKTPTRGVRCGIMLPWRMSCTVYVRVGGLISPRKWDEAMDISTTIDLISLVLFAVGLGITIGKIKK